MNIGLIGGTFSEAKRWQRIGCIVSLGTEKLAELKFSKLQTDEEAVRLAYERRLSVSCEVWDRDRFIAHIQALADLETEGKSKANY